MQPYKIKLNWLKSKWKKYTCWTSGGSDYKGFPSYRQFSLCLPNTDKIAIKNNFLY